MPRGSGNTPENLRRKERDGHRFAVLEDMYISGESVNPIHLAEWEEHHAGGTRRRIVRGERAARLAPAKAVRYTEKTFVFATAIVHELDFKKSAGGVFRAITTENVLYVLQGSATVEVNGEPVPIEAGDAVGNPSGALRGHDDAKILAWTVVHPNSVAAQAMNVSQAPKVVRNADKTVKESAQWDRDGERVVATTPEQIQRAPADAIRLKIESLDLGCNLVGVVTGYQGGPTYEAASRFDNYLYIESGAYTYFQDDVEFEARPGDVIREIAGHYHHWIRHEDSSFIVTTSLPVTPAASD